MTGWIERVLVPPRDDHRRGSIFSDAARSVTRAVATTCIALLVIGLLAVTGCSHPVAATPMQQALADFDAERWDAAIAACDKAIALDPENAAAYLLRGRAQHLAGRLDRAVADLTDAIRLNPQDPEAYYQRANAYRALGQTALKDADNMSARQIDPNYTYQFQTDGPLAMDPAVIKGEPESASKKKVAVEESDDLELDSSTDAPPKRSIVEDMFGMPPDLLDRDRLTPPPTQPRESTTRGWASPTEPEPRAGANRGLAGPGLGGGNVNTSKPARGQSATDRMAPLPAAREGLAGGNELPPGDERRGQPAATRQRGFVENRNLHPYGPSSMRPTGVKDPSAFFVDPKTGLPTGQGRAATVGTPYVAPNPYAPVGQVPGVGASRPATPPRPLFQPPPGNRYDGGRGYGN